MPKFPPLAVLLTVSGLLVGPIAAHAALDQRPAAVQPTVAKPDVALTLVFNADVDLAASSVKITDANGNRVSTGDLRFGPDGHDVEIPLKGALRPGVYSVTFHAVSVFGQDSVGGYDVTIDPVGNPVPDVAQQ